MICLLRVSLQQESLPTRIALPDLQCLWAMDIRLQRSSQTKPLTRHFTSQGNVCRLLSVSIRLSFNARTCSSD